MTLAMEAGDVLGSRGNAFFEVSNHGCPAVMEPATSRYMMKPLTRAMDAPTPAGGLKPISTLTFAKHHMAA